jgi:hypothetical protein
LIEIARSREDGCKRIREREKESVEAQAVYIETSLLSHQRVKGQREPFLALSLFKREHEIERKSSRVAVDLGGA